MPHVPSVTEVIGFVNSRAFENVPQGRLEKAQNHGIDFHELAAAYATKLWCEVPEDCQEEFDAFKVWFDRVVSTTLCVEKAMTHPVWQYRGTPDWIGTLKGHEGITLLDWKPDGALSLAWRLQVSAYRELAIANGYPISRVGIVQRRKGKPARFQGLSGTLIADFAVFLSALNVWRFFN